MPVQTREQLLQLYGDVIRFYSQYVKSAIARAREIDQTQRLSENSAVLLGYAMDSAMEAQADLLSLVGGQPVANEQEILAHCERVICDAHNYIYRAAYDAYDAIMIVLNKQIDGMLNAVSYPVIYDVLPQASEQIFVPRDEINDLRRAAQPRDTPSTIAEQQNYILRIKSEADRLESIRDRIRANMATLTRYEEQERTKEVRAARRHRTGVILAVIGIIVAVIIGAVTAWPSYVRMRQPGQQSMMTPDGGSHMTQDGKQPPDDSANNPKGSTAPGGKGP